MKIRKKKLSQKVHNQTAVVPSLFMPMLPREAAMSQGDKLTAVSICRNTGAPEGFPWQPGKSHPPERAP